MEKMQLYLGEVIKAQEEGFSPRNDGQIEPTLF
jgi:hypothetical protein